MPRRRPPAGPGAPGLLALRPGRFTLSLGFFAVPGDLSALPLGLFAVVGLLGCGAPDAATRDAPAAGAGERAGSESATGADHPTRVVSFVDAADVRHVLDGPARRIVSLVPSATETLRSLGAQGALVGVTDFDTQPRTDSLPSVGGGLEPNLEALVALRPDAVVRFEGEQDPRTPARLDELGIRHVAVRPVSLEDLYRTNRILGRLTGHEAAADSLSRSIREGLAELSRAASAFPRKRVVYMLGGSPPWVSGPGTYIDEILDLVGGDNVFDELGAPYAAVSPEELRSRPIDVVLVTRGGSFDASLTPDARIEVIGGVLEVAGPDVVEAAREMAEVVHGRAIR